MFRIGIISLGILIAFGCAAPLDTSLATKKLQQGYEKEGIQELTYLAEKGYHEANLELALFYLFSEADLEVLKAQPWLSALLPYSDEARMRYAQWLGKLSHIDASVHPLTLKVLRYRYEKHGDVAVELARFLQDYYPDEQNLLIKIVDGLIASDNTQSKDLLRVIDALYDPREYQQELAQLCEVKQRGFEFYCLRSYLRIAKQREPKKLTDLLTSVEQSYKSGLISDEEFISIVDQVSRDSLVSAEIALDWLEPLLGVSSDFAFAFTQILLKNPHQRDIKKLKLILQQTADSGNPRSNLFLGRLFLMEELGFRDTKIAYQYLSKAQTLEEGKYRLAILLLSGELVEPNAQHTDQYAVDLLVSAGRNLYTNAYAYLARLFADENRYFNNPVYANVFAQLYRSLTGETLLEYEVIRKLELSAEQRRDVASMTEKELAFGVKTGIKIEVSERDISYLLGSAL